MDGSVDFARPWAAYAGGFGAPGGNHWLGNEPIHWLTGGCFGGAARLRVELAKCGLSGPPHFGLYNRFAVLVSPKVTL